MPIDLFDGVFQQQMFLYMAARSVVLIFECQEETLGVATATLNPRDCCRRLEPCGLLQLP